MKTIAAALFALVLAACAGTPFKWDNARQLREGMSEQEVTELMGRPYMVTANANGNVWIWSHSTAFGGAQSLSVIFKDGKAVKVPAVPESFK